MRAPDLIIGPRADPQTYRWVIFNWRGWQLCLHKWWRSDEDRALHDHKASNISVILSRQGFAEIVRQRVLIPCDITRTGDAWANQDVVRKRWPLVPYYRHAETPHRVVLFDKRPVWSLWFRFPPRRRWGFHCPKGWVDADVFLSQRGQSDGVGKYYADGISEKGRGCD